MTVTSDPHIGITVKNPKEGTEKVYQRQDLAEVQLHQSVTGNGLLLKLNSGEEVFLLGFDSEVCYNSSNSILLSHFFVQEFRCLIQHLQVAFNGVNTTVQKANLTGANWGDLGVTGLKTPFRTPFSFLFRFVRLLFFFLFFSFER